MTMLNVSRAALAALSLLAASGTWAQGPAAEGASDWQVLVTERLWDARWDHRLVDALVTAPPTATSPPEVTTFLRERTSDKLVPIHSVGLRYKDLLVSASGWSANFDMSGVTASGRTRRTEYDFTVGYAVYDGVSASLTYKYGKVNPAVTARTPALLGLRGSQDGYGLLLGLSALAPIKGKLSLYGNFAFGPGRYQLERDLPGHPRSRTRYTIGDFGASYRIEPSGPAGLDTITLQLGYRYQVMSFRDAKLATPPADQVRLVRLGGVYSQTTTEGLVFSASFAF